MDSQRFNPLDYGFRWTADWYEFDHEAAHKAAMQARNKAAAALVKQGRKVKKWSQSGNLMSKGGIGSGKPHIELVVTVYGFNVLS